MPLGNKPFENTVGKGEIARNEQFLLYPVFSAHLENFLLFSWNLKLSSADCFNLDMSKFLSSGNGLILTWMVRFVFSRIENIILCFSHNIFKWLLLKSDQNMELFNPLPHNPNFQGP